MSRSIIRADSVAWTEEPLFVNGARRSSLGATLTDVVSPTNEEPFARVALAAAADIDAACEAARVTFDSGVWSEVDQAERSAIIRDACRVVDARIEEIAEIQAMEMGAPVAFMRLSGRAVLRSVERLADAASGFPTSEERVGPWRSLVRHEPVGVVASISPWNGPFAMSVAKSATALLAGCVVVDKPAVETPFDAMPWAEALATAGLPSGAYNLVPGGADAGEHLVTHDLVDMVSFTGGTVAGRRIGSLAGQGLKRLVLELGGKSAAVATDDADLDLLVEAVAGSLFPNCGQVCSAFTRVIVPRAAVDDVIDRFVEICGRIVVGDPADPGTTMGPLASHRQYDRVRGFIQSGSAEGARLVVGGDRPADLERGFFLAPTVFADVTNDMTIAREEIFGPVLCVIAHDGDDDAIRMANDSKYGLHGAVFSQDHERARRLGCRLSAGSVTINAYTSNFDAPRTGMRDSGLGARGGIEGFDEHRIARTVNLEPLATSYSPAGLLGTRG